MFDYDKLYEPYTREGHGLNDAILWLRESTKADDRIIDQVVADTMDLLSQGEQFDLPCPCGCGFEEPYTNATIDHFMLAKVFDLKQQAEKAFISVLEVKEKSRLQARMKQLSNFDKEYNKMVNGTWGQKIRKFIGMRYDSWENE